MIIFERRLFSSLARDVLRCGWLLAVICVAGQVRAQDVETFDKPHAAQQLLARSDVAPTEHLLGNWDGLRSSLMELGVDLTPSYESETVGVASGGAKQGADYAHSLGLQVDVDWSKMGRLAGFSTHILLVERAGRNASSDFLHDNLTQLQEIYGGGGDVAAHLGYFYGEQKLLGGAIDLEAGRLDVGQDFASSPLYCEFVGLTDCPALRSLSIESGFTLAPNATWGARLRIAPAKAWYVELGFYQERPDAGGRSGFDWSSTGAAGVLAPVELGFIPRLGPHHLVGHYRLGATYDTSTHRDLSPGQNAEAPMMATHSVRSHRGQSSVYLTADQMVLRTGHTDVDGVMVIAGYTYSNPDIALISQFAFAGVVASGVVPARPKDAVGFQTTWLEVSRNLTSTQDLQAGTGAPLSSGFPGVAAPGVQGHETMLDAFYDIHVARGMHLTPDLKYIRDPDATVHYGDATVLSMRISVDF